LTNSTRKTVGARSLTSIGLTLVAMLWATAAPAQGTGEVAFAGVSHSRYKAAGGPLHRAFAFFSVRRSWNIEGDSTRPLTLSYVLEVIPAAVMTNAPVGKDTVGCSSDPLDNCYRIEPRLGTVYAIGLSPLALRASIKAHERLSFVIDGNGGVLLFNRPIPDPTLTRLNFTGGFGLSVRTPVGRRTAVALGYLRHHTSNAGRAAINPGLDSNMIQLALIKMM
jgi:hypothetical protein